MTFLLDTCAALWYFEGNPRIRDGLRDVLTSIENDVLLSDVSILETVIKCRLGKVSIDQPPSRFFPEMVAQHDMTILPITTEAVFALDDLPLLHRDPFDRLLVAQAKTHGLRLVSPDPLIRQYDIDVHWQ